MAKRRIIFVSVIFLLIAIFSMQALSQALSANRMANIPNPERSQSNKKAAESLNINWRSIQYQKSLHNPPISYSNKGGVIAERLDLSFDVEMTDYGLILCMCQDAVIEQITDSLGTNFEIAPSASQLRPIYMSIQRFMQPGRRPGEPKRRTLRVGLDAGLRGRKSGEIRIKGYLYAITAESLKYVELPFEPNDNWVHLTSDMEIRVRKAQNEASRYRFEIEQRPERVPDPARVQIGDYLPDGYVVDRQIIVKTGSNGTSIRGAPGRIGGKVSGTGRAEKIRFTIAASPAHTKIPFEFEQVPLSVLIESVPPRSARWIRSEFAPDMIKPEQIQTQFNEKVADYFKVYWNWVTYRKTLYNPSIPEKSPDRSISESLYVNCEAEIVDPRLVVGTCYEPVIEQITDGNGREIDISREQTRPDRMYYRSLRYQVRASPPSKLLQWEGKVRTTLGLPLRPRHQRKRSLELKPARLGIELDPELIRQETREIESIKGYFYALTAESIKHVKIPYKASDKWIRLTPDVEIQFPTARQSQFEIKQRWQAGKNVSHLLVGDRWPNEIVADLQFIGADDRPNYLRNRGGRQLPVSLNSGENISGRKVEKIDFLIAVGPTHSRIPFEIEHISLPKP
ncbi:MAG: hypothetical protein ACYS3S_15050 [Planctomycetota bacterium]